MEPRVSGALELMKGLPGRAWGLATKYPVPAGVLGLAGLGGAKMIYDVVTADPPTQTELVQAQNQQQRGQGYTAPQYQSQVKGIPYTALSEEDKMKERLRLLKEQNNLSTDYALNSVYQHALGYRG